MISKEGVDLQTPPGKEREDHRIYNGNTRIYGPDGQLLIAEPSDDFEGLVYVDIDLDETHLSKALNDFVSFADIHSRDFRELMLMFENTGWSLHAS